MTIADACCPPVFRFSTALAALAPERAAVAERPWLSLGALAVVLCDCGADRAAAQLVRVDAALGAGSEGVGIDSAIRHMIAGILAQDSCDRDAYLHEHRRAAAQLRSSGIHGEHGIDALSVLIMILRSPRLRLQASDVARVAHVHRLVRTHHLWGTQAAAEPIAATLAAARGPAQAVDEVFTGLASRLESRTGAPTAEVEAAAAILVASALSTDALDARMDELLDATQEPERPGALPAAAMLAQLPCPAAEAAAHYQAILASLAAVGDPACARTDALIAAGLACESLARLDALALGGAAGHRHRPDARVRRFHADCLLAAASLLPITG